jgi:hypothetical protein
VGAVFYRSARPVISRRLQVNLHSELVGGPKEGEKASDYLRRQLREGRMYVGFDVDDAGLGFAVQKAGHEAFVFGSDFPHEVFNGEGIKGHLGAKVYWPIYQEAEKLGDVNAIKGNTSPSLKQQARPAVASSEREPTLGEMEKSHILEVLQQTNWRIEGPKGAALILGLHPNTLRHTQTWHSSEANNESKTNSNKTVLTH